MNSKRTYYFAGGGTGGHIYPAIAVAEQIKILAPDAEIIFFTSTRPIDKKILSAIDCKQIILPAEPVARNPFKLPGFAISQIKSYKIAKQILSKTPDAVLMAAGGFVCAAPTLAAKKLKIPIALLNVDIVPGKANQLLKNKADFIFTQFKDTARILGPVKAKVINTGCPLRKDFKNPHPQQTFDKFQLDENKKTLLITGASSGSKSINSAICSAMDRLNDFADTWQIIHLAGHADHDRILQAYKNARIQNAVLPYYDNMPELLHLADLALARAGAVSIAEFTAAHLPVICVPYPYHKDRHQYLNAEILQKAGSAIIVDDPAISSPEKLIDALLSVLADENKLAAMAAAAKSLPQNNAAEQIAQLLSALTS